MEMDHEKIQLGNLLMTRYPLQVPVYQRLYAWTTEQVDDFINDLTRLAAGSSEATYFFGLIITVKVASPEDTTHSRFEVVDGQQRLTTFSLALKAIQRGFEELTDEAKAEGVDDALVRRLEQQRERIGRDFLFYEDGWRENDYTRPRLTLSKDDHEHFAAILNDTALVAREESHKKLAQAFTKISKLLVHPVIRAAGEPVEARAASLSELLRAVTHRVVILNLTVNARRNGYRLFEVLNDRGRPLTEADLLRTRSLELLDGFPDILASAEEAWSRIRRHDEVLIEAFLRAYYASHVGERASTRHFLDDLYTAFLPELVSNREQASRVLALIKALAAEIEVFDRISRAAWPWERDAQAGHWERDRLQRLMLVLKHKSSRPLLLAAATKGGEQVFIRVLMALERFVFRYVICKGHPSKAADVLIAQAHLVRLSGDDYDTDALRETLRELCEEEAPDEMFRAGLSERLQYSKKTQPIIAHFLTTIEQFRVRDSQRSGSPQFDTSAVFDLGKLHIEHIFPQTPRIADRELAPLTHSLGNLSFWHPQDNRAANNEPFERKKARYEESKVEMTRKLAEWDTLGPDLLKRREGELVKMALKIWTV